MMSWSPTEEINSVSGAVVLLSRAVWRESTYGSQLRQIVHWAVDHDDRVLRFHAAHRIRLLEPEPTQALTLLRQRLLTEPEPEVAAVLANELGGLAAELPHDVDALVDELLTAPMWSSRWTSTEHDTVESLIPLVALMVRLAVVEETPAASRATMDLFGQPIAHRAGFVFREWLALPPNRGAERRRAFAILHIITQELDTQRLTSPDDATDLYKSAYNIVTQVYFASGAFNTGDQQPTPPQDGFAEEAFPILEALTAFKEPAIVHRLVQTLGQLASNAPSQAFHILEQAVLIGDAYTYDRLAADATIGLIERYLAEFRDVLAVDADLLSAVRCVLSAFAQAGWAAAVSLSSRLSDILR